VKNILKILFLFLLMKL